MKTLAKSGPTVLVPKPLASRQDITFSARQLANEALEVVAELMRSSAPALRLRAAQEILDRAVGKAPIKVDVTESLSPEEIKELAGRILAENPTLNPPVGKGKT